MDKSMLLLAFFLAVLFAWGLKIAVRICHYKYIKFKRAAAFRKKYRKHRYWLPSIIAGLIAFPLLVYLLNFNGQALSTDAAHWGQMGDFFGGVLNPILAFASFIALLYTIRIQSKEMADTRAEMHLSRLAQEHAVAAANAQLLSMEQQRITAFCFQMIGEIKSSPNPKLTDGAIDFLKKENAQMLYTLLPFYGFIDLNLPEKIRQLLDFLEKSLVSPSDKKILADQLRLSLSHTQVFLIALSISPFARNGSHSEENFDKTRALIKKYNLLRCAMLVTAEINNINELCIAWSPLNQDFRIPLKELDIDVFGWIHNSALDTEEK
jgi:uncharacterized membrane protein